MNIDGPRVVGGTGIVQPPPPPLLRRTLCISVPLPPHAPSISMYFLELSQAPPALAIISASIIPDAMAPPNIPVRQRGPMRNPTVMGDKIAYNPGKTISWTADCVAMATHLSESACAVPSRKPGISAN